MEWPSFANNYDLWYDTNFSMDFWNKQKLAIANEELSRAKAEIAALRQDLTELSSTVKDLEDSKLLLTSARNELQVKIDSMHAQAASLPPMITVAEANKLVEEREVEIIAGRTAYWQSVVQQMLSDVKVLIEQKSIGFPWLAEALSEYYGSIDKLYAEHLRKKKRPALVQADRIREIAEEKMRFKKEYTIMKYVLRYYESLFPWLRDYIGLNAEELIAEANRTEISSQAIDPVQQFISSGEYELLASAERNQIALNRYWQSRKSNWQVGRDYERYVGYLYEQQGYKVQYFGIERGLEDLGRDLVCIKDDLVEVVQCKYWSKTKGMLIREAYVNQLFGTTVKHYIDNLTSSQRLNLDAFMRDYDTRIRATMVTSTNLSDEAMRFANALGITVREELDMDKNYPCIKCNINQQTGERIYHLPFDQQYDRVVIESSLGEFYAHTVEQAEKNGFRRAWRWQGVEHA